MLKTLNLEYVKPNTVTTKFGEKTKYSLKTPDGQWYDCWDNCNDLKQGDSVIGFVTDREYNGKTYYDFKRLKPTEEFLLKEIQKLAKRVSTLEGGSNNEITEMGEEDIPF